MSKAMFQGGFAMKRTLLFFVICTCLLITPVLTQAQAPTGYSVTCDDGTSFNNGVEVSVNQLRSGYTYRATAIGLNGFDPVLAVLDQSTNRGLCDDDDSAAATYAASLPSSGSVPASSQSAQVTFNQNSSSAFADVSLVVGGYNNQSGEFLLILEGMDATAADGAGDSFSVNITPGMVASGVPITVYMIAEENSLDPFMYQSNGSLTQLKDSSGNPIGCDDAGDANSCWGQSTDLSNSFVTGNGGTVAGGAYDAMLRTPIDGLQLNNDRSQNYYTFVMTSSPQQKSEGHYLVVFDIAQSDSSANSQTSGQTGGDEQNGGQTNGGQTDNSKGGLQNPFATSVPNNGNNSNNSSSGSNGNNGGNNSSNSGQWQGWSVTCDDGSSFDNGVEVIMNQVSPNTTYTATAIGLNGFDPVLAVIDSSNQNANGLCNNDSSAASTYTATLPSSGQVAASRHSAQVTFTRSDVSTSGDVSLVVGGNNNQTGEFLLILEGQGITSSTTTGDVYNVNVTPGMVTSGVPLSLYMIAENTDLDPFMYQTDSKLTQLKDDQNNPIGCDDAGDGKSCWGQSDKLSNSSLTVGRGSLSGGDYDSMLSFSLDGLQLNSDPTQNYFTFIMTTSPSQKTTGKYIAVFDIGIGASGNGSFGKGTNS